MSLYYWGRALAAVDKKRLKLVRQDVPEDLEDQAWREVERLTWLEEFARASLHMAEEAEIF
jgi:hypothetical protein